MEETKKEARELRRPLAANCESCLYYDCDEDGDYACTMDLDQDEYYRYVSGAYPTCPYYRYYDEYKSVARQN